MGEDLEAGGVDAAATLIGLVSLLEYEGRVQLGSAVRGLPAGEARAVLGAAVAALLAAYDDLEAHGGDPARVVLQRLGLQVATRRAGLG